MELLNLSIRELNNLFVNKKAKPSELYSEIFDRAANSEAALHAHLSLFEETNLEKAKNSDERFSNSENVGLLDVSNPIFINNHRFVHSLVYTGKKPRGVFLAYGIRDSK